MGQVLHGSAKTTHVTRGELQRSEGSAAQLAEWLGINEKTALKWRKRQSVEDMPMGPKEGHSTVLTPMEEAAIVALHVHARLPLDDVYIALKDVIPRLTRSTLHRCLPRHGISCPPRQTGKSRRNSKPTRSVLPHRHRGIALEDGKGFLFAAVDRTSRLVFARIYRKAAELVAGRFMKSLIRNMPYTIHAILTDNGVQFIQREQGTGLTFPHTFGRVVRENNIEHRLTKAYHPCTNGQAERMVRTIKEATLRCHVRDWLIAYNFAKQLKAEKFRMPYEAIQELWKSKPEVFVVKPDHHMLGLNT